MGLYTQHNNKVQHNYIGLCTQLNPMVHILCPEFLQNPSGCTVACTCTFSHFYIYTPQHKNFSIISRPRYVCVPEHGSLGTGL